MIENEQWTQAEVPIDFQLMVDSFARSKSGELNQEEEEDSRMKYWKEKEEDSDTASIMSSARRPRAGMESKSSQLIKVGGEQFFVVGVVLLFVKIVTDYIQCAQFVPALVTDVLNRILELLKVGADLKCDF
jgi:vacuolar protein sorting-associated protein 54